MGYAMIVGHCYVCNQVFSMNPHKVPSVNVRGTREPVCKDCMDNLIARELKLGIEPKRYAPDAYDAIPEEEL